MELQDINNRTQLGAKLFVTPQPALMIGTYDENGNPDVMMAAWGGQCDMNQVCFRLSPHRTTTNLRATKEFTLSFATQRDVAQSDYFGIVSANDVPDKIARAGFTVTKSANINAPIINEYPLTLECKVVEIMERGDDGCFVIGEIVNTIADPAILTDGNIDLDKLQPIVFDMATLSYRSVGGIVGKAWGSGKVFVEE
ncbi:MAG: flavin reductase family protein [Bacteroidales bacterium]|nr:flavin reductase family protein [Bacteroidales bacterium]